MKKKIIFAAVAALLLAVLGGFYWMLTKDRREVENLVKNTAQWVSVKPRKVAHEGMLKHTKVSNYFAPNVSISIVKPDISRTLTADNQEQYLMLYFRNTQQMSVETENIEVEIADGKAVFFCNARISGVLIKGSVEFDGVYIVSGSAEKIDGNWKISSIVAEPAVQ